MWATNSFGTALSWLETIIEADSSTKRSVTGRAFLASHLIILATVLSRAALSTVGLQARIVCAMAGSILLLGDRSRWAELLTVVERL